MLKRKFVPVALSGLLFASPLVMAVDEHHPEKAAEVTQDAPSLENAPGDAATAPSGMMKPGMMSGRQNTDIQGGTMMMGRPGMMKGGPGMMGNRGGMMRRMMMGGQQGGGEMMGPGMMKGGSGMMGQGGGHGMGGHGMMRKHQQVLNRLDLLDARMAKIEAMLERLMLR
jgi:hypothetical protein